MAVMSGEFRQCGQQLSNGRIRMEDNQNSHENRGEIGLGGDRGWGREEVGEGLLGHGQGHGCPSRDPVTLPRVMLPPSPLFLIGHRDTAIFLVC